MIAMVTILFVAILKEEKARQHKIVSSRRITKSSVNTFAPFL
jgi:hypothetical protein